MNRAQGDVESIVLRAAGETDVAPTTHAASSGSYTWNGLDSSKSYSVVVNGYVTTNVVTISAQNPMVVELYRAVLAQDPAGTGADLKLEKADGSTVGGTAGYYYVAGQTFGVSTTVPAQKSFVNWTETHHGSTVTDNPRSTSEKINYVMPAYPVTLTAHFDDIVEYVIQLGNIGTTDGLSTMTYSGGQSYLDILTGGTKSDPIYKVRAGATFGLPQPVTGTPNAGQYAIEHNHSTGSYTFRGWTTAPGNTADAAAGAFVFTANEAADQADGNDDNVITLYPVWTQDSELALSAGVIKGVYKHSTLTPNHTETATGGTGSPVAHYTYSTGTLPFGITMTSGGVFETSNGVPNDTGAETAVITVTDGTFNATADYSFVIDKANVVPDGTNGLPTNKSIAVDSMDEAHVKALFGSTVMNGDGTGENGVNGSWAVKTGYTLPTTPGTYAIPVVFTPENKNGATTGVDAYGKHYNPYETTITVEVTAKLITAANILVDEAATNGVPNTLATVQGHTNTLTPAAATWTNDVEITNVVWSPTPGSAFAANTAYTVTVYLRIKNGSQYRFDTTSFKGTINGDGVNTKQLGLTAETASFSLEFAAEPTKLTTIDVTVGTLGVGSTTTNVTSGEPAKYTVTGYTWVEKGTTTQVTAPGFDAAKDYDVLVTVRPEAGYEFDDGVFGGSVGTELKDSTKWNATVNKNSDLTTGKTATVQTVLNTSDGTIQIRYSFFEPEAETLVAISSVTGDLGIYYAQMSDASGHMHYNNAATGHKSGIDFTFDPSGITVTATYQNTDGDTTDKTVTTGRTFYVIDPANSTNRIVLYSDGGTAGRTFKDFGTDHDLALDGLMVYVEISGLATSTQVDRLAVKKLTVMSITDTAGAVPNLTYTAGTHFDPTATGTGKPKVSFNTDTDALSNDVTLTAYGVDNRDANQPTNWFFALNADGTSELTTATVMDYTAHNGKTVYLCYADVNDRVVSAPVGTLTIRSTGMAVTVTDENKHQPEYGDKLTAEPTGGTGTRTYQWEVQNGANWDPIPGATGKDYVPGKGDVGDTIRVTVTDSTGATASSTGMEIMPRSLNFDVRAWDKVYDGDAYNEHSYDTTDFTLIMVTDAVDGNYGGVILGDVVTLAPAGTWNNAEATRPVYASAAANSNLAWPAVNASGTNAGAISGYTVGSTDGTYYRLAPQVAQPNKGKIVAQDVTTVSHVDVHFAEVPIFSHNIPVEPTGVTLNTETKPGENTNDGTSVTDFTATWYKGAFNVTAPGSATTDTTFGADTYTVVVKVRPRTEANYQYGASTHYYFHFGADETKEVTLKDSTAAAAAANGVYVDASGAYVMWYTFNDVARPKIAHVNVSVPQPVVYGAPANGTVNQALGTDSSNLTANVTMNNIHWYNAATGGTEITGSDQFAAGGTYRVEFDLTASDYQYLNATDKVDFTVSGVGPIEGANHIGDNTNPANTVIESVTTTATNADSVYHVVVVYRTIQGGKVDLTDVVVDASPATAADIEKTGPEVDSDKQTIYNLTGSNNKWQYWNGAAWADASDGTGLSADGKFLAGYDYRVTAQVHLVDTTHYQIGTGTKFYLAGLECTTTAETVNHGSYTPLVPSAAAGADGKYADTVTFTLTKEFSIPANGIGMVTVTYDLPLNSGTTVPSAPEYYGNQDMVNIANNATSWVKLGTTDTYKNDFTSAGSAPGTTFEESQYYRVTSVVTPKTGYKFTNGTVVVINGVPVTVDGAEGEVKENGTTVAYVKAVTDGNNVKAMLIAKVRSTAIDPIELKHADITPVAENAPSSALFELAKAGEARYEVDTTMHNGGKGTWQYEDSPNHWKNAVINDGLDASGKFLSGTKYRVTVGVKATGTNVFAAGASGTVDNTANSTKKNATVQVAADRKTATLTVTFDPTNIKTASMVDVYFRRQPEVGKNPATLQEDGNWVYKFPATVNNAPTETVGTLTGTGMEQFDVKWYDTTGTTFDPSASNTPMTGNFAAHKSYTVTVRVKPAAGWQYILDTDPNTEDTKFTIFASDAGHTSNNVWYDAAKGDYVMWYTFAPTEDPNVIVRVAANVTQPAADETMSSTATKILAQTSMGTDVTASGLNLGTVSWKESVDGTTWSNATGSFAAGKYYQATFTASAASGYSFLADGADNVDFLVNSVGWIDGAGSKTENGIKVETAQNGGTNSYTITVTFPMTGSTADILTVWGNAKEPVAGGTINHGDITVSPVEPYAIKSNTNKWYTDAACTTEATGTFQPGTTYYARLTVELKGQYSGIYQFAQTTQGYINDTTGGTTVMRDPTTGTPTSITLTRAFPVPAVSTDLMVYGNAVEPTAGNTASTNNITAINGQPYEKASAQWLDDTGNPFTGQFQPGKTYIAELTVRVKNTNTHSFDASTKGFLNNGEVTGADKILNADGTLTLRKSFKLEDSSITKVVVNSATPTPGSALPDSINPGDSSKYTFENESWAATDGTPTTTVEYSKSYTMTVTVVPKDDTINLPRTDTSGYTWNGRTASNAVDAGDGKYTVTFEYTTGPKPADPPPPSGGGTTTVELPVVTYWISDHGFTNDLTAEKMSRSGAKPTFTPKVSGKEGYTFKGWSEVDPATLKQGEEVKLVDPLTFSISADKTFYAVYDEPRFEHDHYVSGYPDGTFKPEQYITRAEVAAIVANACLDGFDNNENYGNPGNYSDINPKKWYGNDIAYCTMYGVFSGYKDGTFKPDQYITRQELAVVVANMAGMQTNIGMPFTDASSINKWARDGVYTVYKNNWVSGYPDGTFRPQNNITRAETVAIFNGYLHRGVDADGLAELTPYVLNAAAGGYEGDGSSLYMTWTDVPEKYWAYYHIIEAANDHDYHWADEETKLPPEHWDAAYIDQEWRYREEFPVTYVVGDHGTAPDGSVLNLSVKSGGRPRTQPHIDPNADWTFLGWSLTPTGDIVEPLTVTIMGETTFYAVYAPKATTYTVRYDAGTDGAVSGASSESVIEGQTPAHVPAVNAHEGYSFLGWAEIQNGTVVDPAGVAITADKTFYAVYRADQPDVQLQSHTAYMSGYDDGTFRPSQAITRADVVTMVVRALGTDYDPDRVYDTSSVSDVEGHPAQNMIGYCIEKGIFSGYKDGTFLPEGTMTRQEFAVVIANLAGGAQENQGLPFTDADSVNKWARNAVYTVYSNGWIGGYKDGSFQPKNNITRAEAAVIFNGFLGRNVNKTSLTDVPAGATSPWSDVKATNWAYQNIMEATSDHSFYLDGEVEHWAEP